ncbi:unnamed protein product [Prunus armeniaca]|uniref:Uncharacterized protein n=1 Tax=Prunus armeniaca TaxID=36596 RepID=A0A6J5XS43_PRUAR|nr:unnamed protein product [Prunus armeniaca]
MTIPEAKQNPVMTRLPMSPKTWHVPSHQKCKEQNTSLVTNEDEIPPKEATAKLNKSTEERLDKMMEIREAMRALICSKDKAEQGDPQGQKKLAKPVIHRRT